MHFAFIILRAWRYYRVHRALPLRAVRLASALRLKRHYADAWKLNSRQLPRFIFAAALGLNSPFRACFQIGDRIIEVDGVDLRHSTHERAVEVIQAAGNPVSLLVQSLVNLVRKPSHVRPNIDVSASARARVRPAPASLTPLRKFPSNCRSFYRPNFYLSPTDSLYSNTFSITSFDRELCEIH